MTAPRTSMGPVEWVALAFPGATLDRSIVPVLAGLLAPGTVAIIDAAVLHKSADGVVSGAELEDEDGAVFGGVDGEVLELLSEDDLAQIAIALEVDTTTLVLVWENRWAAALGDAVARAHGRLVAHDRVSRAVVERALDGLSASAGVSS